MPPSTTLPLPSVVPLAHLRASRALRVSSLLPLIHTRQVLRSPSGSGYEHPTKTMFHGNQEKSLDAAKVRRENAELAYAYKMPARHC